MNRATSEREANSRKRRLCAYMHRVCQLPRIAGRKYCLRHILEDRDSPYKQCHYTHPTTQRKCRYPAAKTDRREYLCKLHVNKNKKNVKRVMPLNETPHKVFEALEIYCQKPEHNAQMATTSRSTLKFFDPDSDQEPPTIENCYIYDGDSDAESVDDDITDSKKNAGYYAGEEAAKITLEKMQRLQTLYLEQFQRLRYVYEERKRDFFYQKQFEKGNMGKEFTSPRDERLYRRYVAYRNYRRAHGIEAILKQKMKQKRRAMEEQRPYPPPKSAEEICVFDECRKVRIPFSEYCVRHILNDTQQKLFKACGVDGCSQPVYRIRGRDTCPEHVPLEFDTQKLVEESLPEGVEIKEEPRERFDGIDDLAALGLDAVDPGSLFGLNQSGISVTAGGDESTDSATSDNGLPTDIALYDEDLFSPQPGPSRIGGLTHGLNE
ncbi:KAT8 regulatory NSL complex subunit 2 [Galendromus occidentalis]|uniref:KAT8 regulatory NSL complex subunit 2 n=1 Tax=Galendromus occidentalis TaxID=34638 RepID=A0AAJ6QT64_9ACAR|nr:KAT8 regulatory NSL complex subunit 2 [Galendromus occidentalis]